MLERTFTPHPDISLEGQPSLVDGERLWCLLGLTSCGMTQHEEVKGGFPFIFLARLSSVYGISQAELARYAAISSRTLRRRAKVGRFTMLESDRFYLFATALIAAISLFEGDLGLAQTWLSRPMPALAGSKPIEMLSSYVGTKAVLDLIDRIEHGVFV